MGTAYMHAQLTPVCVLMSSICQLLEHESTTNKRNVISALGVYTVLLLTTVLWERDLVHHALVMLMHIQACKGKQARCVVDMEKIGKIIMFVRHDDSAAAVGKFICTHTYVLYLLYRYTLQETRRTQQNSYDHQYEKDIHATQSGRCSQPGQPRPAVQSCGSR